MIIVESAGLTDVGLKRKNNEDAFSIDDKSGLYLVADGMGGHLAGEIASKILVDTVCDYMGRFNNGESVEHAYSEDENLSLEANCLLSSIYQANRSIFQFAQQKSEHRGMGSTVSAVYLTPKTLIAANVGDSPIYLARKGIIDELYTPHTLLEEQKSLFPESTLPEGENFGHILTQAMGSEHDVKVDICEIQAFVGDRIIICSDGISDKIVPEEILAHVEENSPAAACEKLVALAKDRGGHDNITIIVLWLKKIQEKKKGISKFFSKIFGLG